MKDNKKHRSVDGY